MITGTTKLLGVIGYPVEHSLSPLMHNAALTKMDLDFVYLPLPIAPENLATAIAGFACIGLQGFNVTIPHKQTIIPMLSEISDLARDVGAVNTVVRTKDGWWGTNTDVAGFISPLQTTHQGDWSDARAIILGYGGAARAVVVGCIQLGIKQIHVVGRNLSKLTDFLHSWQNLPITVNLQVHSWDDLSCILPQGDLLVNTTPVGMYPHIDASPLSAAEMMLLRENTIVYDLIYTPNPTKFLSHAQVRGMVAIDGLSMLIQQGVAALKIWLERDDIPVEVMGEVLRQHLFA